MDGSKKEKHDLGKGRSDDDGVCYGVRWPGFFEPRKYNPYLEKNIKIVINCSGVCCVPRRG